MTSDAREVAVVFGARRLGRGIASYLAEHGWSVIAVARSPETIASLTGDRPDIVGRVADLGTPDAAADVLRMAADRYGRIDLVVNAIADASVSNTALARANATTTLGPPLDTAIRPVHNVIDAALTVLRDQGNGTLIQITGGLALRARRGSAALAATAHATRALIEGSIVDAREEGVHVALLVIRGLIESDLTAHLLVGKPRQASMSDSDVTAAIAFLLDQRNGRAWTHELTLTPPGADWPD